MWVLYAVSAYLLALVGLNALVLSLMLLVRGRRPIPAVPPVADETWPRVLVQLPVFNERHVVERLVEAVTALDYPRDRLYVQLLDDSTDDTEHIAAAAVARARELGLDIAHIRRDDRVGFKAGALAYGLTLCDAEFVAIFDADFVPQPGFLKMLLPHLLADEHVGMVQARWAHINAGYSHLTRAQALALDSHFAVEQPARHRNGLLMNFSGTAGIWRTRCINASGGWDLNTLSEDIDLSYRAQLSGWRFLYLPEVGVPGEIPPLMMGFKRQQARWATGTVQCLRKLGPHVLGSQLTLWQKVQAMLHLGGYLIHPLMLLTVLLALPMTLSGGFKLLPLAGLGLAMIGPPLQTLLAQRRLYPDWPRRLLNFPVLMLLGTGIAVSNTQAVLRGMSDRPQAFVRTPKFQLGEHRGSWAASQYTLPLDAITFLEGLFSLYAAVTAVLAFTRVPALAPFMILYALGFAYVAGTSVIQALVARRTQAQARTLHLGSASSTR